MAVLVCFNADKGCLYSTVLQQRSECCPRCVASEEVGRRGRMCARACHHVHLAVGCEGRTGQSERISKPRSPSLSPVRSPGRGPGAVARARTIRSLSPREGMARPASATGMGSRVRLEREEDELEPQRALEVE
eukprot:767499-Hanusia_phi.AAC.1